MARTLSQQLSPAVERATSPYEYAMTTRAGCECVAHVLQGLTHKDPQVTVTSIDGLGAYDMISRGGDVAGSDERLRCSTPLHAHVLRQKFRALVGDGQW